MSLEDRDLPNGFEIRRSSVLGIYVQELDQRSIIADNCNIRDLQSRNCNYKFKILDNLFPKKFPQSYDEPQAG